MIRSSFEARSFQIAAQKHYGLYNCRNYSVWCGQFFLFVISCAEPVASRLVASIFLFLKNYMRNLIVTSIGVQGIPSFTS